MTAAEQSARELRLREFFDLPSRVSLVEAGVSRPQLTGAADEHFRRIGFEWHVIPAAAAVSWDERYAARLYPTGRTALGAPLHHGATLSERLERGHRLHQGRFIAVEATQKPGYLPGNVQYYGTPYGFDASRDPLVRYMGQAGFVTRTRYDLNFGSLSQLIRVLDDAWRGQGLLPEGYRVSICAPAVFNLVGTVFHTEWSDEASLELGFYRDAQGNAECFAVGPNGPGDFSFVQLIETESEWIRLGFRLALVPEE